MPLSKEAKIERDKHIKMMESKDDWPIWPVLPLKRRDEFTNVGCIVAIEEVKFVVFEGNIMTMPTNLMDMARDDDWPKYVYKSYAEMYDAGWRVD